MDVSYHLEKLSSSGNFILAFPNFISLPRESGCFLDAGGGWCAEWGDREALNTFARSHTGKASHCESNSENPPDSSSKQTAFACIVSSQVFVRQAGNMVAARMR